MQLDIKTTNYVNIFDFTLKPDEMSAISTLDMGRSTIYDEHLLDTTRFIGSLKIHD